MDIAKIKAICFDLDDTLWETGPVLKSAEEALFAWLDVHYPRITELYSIHTLSQLRLRLVRENPKLKVDLTELRKTSLAVAAYQAGYPEELAEDAFEIFIEARNKLELYPDVLPALQALQKHFRLCSLTNGNADPAKVGLNAYFELNFSSREAGAAKPDAEVYEQLCQRLNLLPEQVLHIGDDIYNDVLGPKAVGLEAAWLNRQQRSWPLAKMQKINVYNGLSELVIALLDADKNI